jgi:hypothetical protein
MGAILLVATVVPACQGPRTRREPVTPYQAYRPPYYGEPILRPKYLAGYAGHNYGQAPHAPSPPTADQGPQRPGFLSW